MIESLIQSEHYHQFPNLVVCCLVLKSGQSVTGESMADGQVGRNEALANARAKAWTYMPHRDAFHPFAPALN
jgi:hypothetical protein